jgi:hypothetical protein
MERFAGTLLNAPLQKIFGPIAKQRLGFSFPDLIRMFGGLDSWPIMILLASSLHYKRLLRNSCVMDIRTITVRQLKRAAVIKVQIDRLTERLTDLLDSSTSIRRTRKKHFGMSAAGRKRIAAGQRARWAKLRKNEANSTAKKPTRKAGKRTMSRAARAQRSAKMKAYWAAKKKSNRK